MLKFRVCLCRDCSRKANERSVILTQWNIHFFFSTFSRNYQVDVPFVKPFGPMIWNGILSGHPSFPLLFGSYFSNNLGTVSSCNITRTVLLQFQYFVQRLFFLQFIFSCRVYFAVCCMNLISEAVAEFILVLDHNGSVCRTMRRINIYCSDYFSRVCNF